jgi:methylmalonyl-CoA mutase
MSNIFTDDFETSSAAAWKQKIQFELNGADYNQTLLTKTNEGITIKPFYHADDFEKISIPSPPSSFKICQSIIIQTAEEANLKAIASIEKGVNSIKLYASKPFELNILFQNLLNKEIEFQFHLDFLSEQFIEELSQFLNSETLYLNIDIIGNLAKTGNWFSNLNTDFNTLENIIKKNKSSFIISVNTDLYQNAGANTVQQVAYVLAHVNEYFNKFGVEIANKIQFNFAIGSNYFFEISKLRAFRYLYQLICEQYNIKGSAKIFIEPSFRNKTANNYNNNVQRASIEYMSGILGGANTISNNITNKTCLNQLVLLKEEFSNKNLQDITTDSYYVESITKQIAEKALEIFKEIEKGGGFLEQLKEGTIQRKITENATKEQIQFETGQLILIGANKYKTQHKADKTDYVSELQTSKNIRKTVIIPVIPKRLSEKMEQKQ